MDIKEIAVGSFLMIQKWILWIVRLISHSIMNFRPGKLSDSVKTHTRCYVTEDGQRIFKRTPTEQEAKLLPIKLPENVFEILNMGKERSKNGNCVGYRPGKDKPFVWLTYQEVIDRSTDFGAGLLALGAKTDSEFLVGIFIKTSVEWTIAEYGCLAYGMITAPLYDTLGSESCIQLINFQEIEIIVCGGDTQVTAMFSQDELPRSLRVIITVEPLNEQQILQVQSLGVKVCSMRQVEDLGRINPTPLHLSSSESVVSLIFTSGTTGIPKAAMLTHSNFLKTIETALVSIMPFVISPDDVVVAYLPLAHIMERIWEKMILLNGGQIGYLSDGLTNLFTDCQELKPTYMLFVPRIMEKMRSSILAGLRKNIFLYLIGKVALAWKFHQLKIGHYDHDTWCDKMIFRKIQLLLGGRLRAGVTGSAAVDGKLLNFMRTVLSCYVFEGYGLSESCGMVSATRFGDLSIDHIGEPCLGMDIKFEDVPEMGYFAKDSCGEICSRSAWIMKSYRRMPEKTAETIDKDGWLHTGDIGCWTSEGKLRIIDRKKHIFKLSQGEYVAPERLESIFSQSKYVSNIFVDGDSHYPFPVALVFPNISEFPGYSIQHSEKFIISKILEELRHLASDSQLKHYEIPNKVHLLKQPFSIQNGCLTQTQKLRREIVRNLYREELKKLYQE